MVMVTKTTFRRRGKRCCAMAVIAVASSLAAAAMGSAMQNGKFGPTTSVRPTSKRQAESRTGDHKGSEGSTREGTRIETVGSFKIAGDRAVFRPKDGSVQYQGLENLALERITGVLANSRNKDIEWTVTGTLTEFRGRNYLLIERAVVKARAISKDRKRTRAVSTKTNMRRPSSSP